MKIRDARDFIVAIAIVLTIAVGVSIFAVYYSANINTKASAKVGKDYVVDTASIRGFCEGEDGEFIVGVGKIKRYDSENKHYSFFCDSEDVGMKFFAFDAEKTLIYDSLPEGEKPYAELVEDKEGTLVQVRMYIPEGSLVFKELPSMRE